jgi:hypothetical protein
MKRNKPVHLPLFEPPARWSELPLDTQQKVVEQVALLCVQLQQAHSRVNTLTSADACQETDTTQETHHDS